MNVSLLLGMSIRESSNEVIFGAKSVVGQKYVSLGECCIISRVKKGRDVLIFNTGI